MGRERLSRSRLDCVTGWEARAERAGYRIAVLAKQCGVSERQLRRFFQCRFRKPPRPLLAEWRLGRGASALRGPLLVKEAAALAGFKSAAHFTHLFTRQYGLPPSAFRSAPLSRPSV